MPSSFDNRVTQHDVDFLRSMSIACDVTPHKLRGVGRNCCTAEYNLFILALTPEDAATTGSWCDPTVGWVMIDSASMLAKMLAEGTFQHYPLYASPDARLRSDWEAFEDVMMTAGVEPAWI